MDLGLDAPRDRATRHWRAALRCPECSGALVERWGGLHCDGDGAFFATIDGVHRLLAAERREEIRCQMAFYARVRSDEGWCRSEALPKVPRGHIQEDVWRQRASHFEEFLAWLDRGPGPRRIVDIGAGCCWAAERLAERGHDVAAVDVNLCPKDGLLAIDAEAAARRGIERIEADMEFLPLDAGVADVALLNGTLHYTRCAQNVLAEARRVLAPGGALVVLDTPVYRRAADGEAMLRARRRRFLSDYGYAPDRDSAAGYFTLGELRRLFHRSGLAVQTLGWPGRLREAARDLIEIARHGRRTARFPMVVARKAAQSA